MAVIQVESQQTNFLRESFVFAKSNATIYLSRAHTLCRNTMFTRLGSFSDPVFFLKNVKYFPVVFATVYGIYLTKTFANIILIFVTVQLLKKAIATFCEARFVDLTYFMELICL